MHRSDGSYADTADRPSVASILQHVAFEMDKLVDEILGPSRKQQLARARYATAWLARRLSGKTLAQIGRAMGGRDHSTISHEIARAEELREADDDFRGFTDQLENMLVQSSARAESARPCPLQRRRHEPWRFVELLAIVRWLREGDPISQIAIRLRRPIPEVRRVIYGDDA